MVKTFCDVCHKEMTKEDFYQLGVDLLGGDVYISINIDKDNKDICRACIIEAFLRKYGHKQSDPIGD